MILTNNTNVQASPVWNVVKDWDNEDKVQLITLLSISLTKRSDVKESPEEKTKRMLAKYAGCWKGNDSAEDTIKCINEGRHSSFEPLKYHAFLPFFRNFAASLSNDAFFNLKTTDR